MSGAEPSIAIIGGSGLYDLPGLEPTEELRLATPFGAPSGPIRVGVIAGRRVLFLARHGAGHRLSPAEVNARANLWALKAAGATRVLSVSAVGSLREAIAPGDFVVVSQFLDFTRGRARSFFGDGVVAHVSLADPVCPGLASQVTTAARGRERPVHAVGTYACIEGPRFSTRAESHMFRQLGADVVGMTNMPEAALAREAELCYATLALPTDHDCWRPDDEVRVHDVLAQLAANVRAAAAVVADVIVQVDPHERCACQAALDAGLITPLDQIAPARATELALLLARRRREARS